MVFFFPITGELEISLLEATNYRMVQQGAHSICYWWAMQCNYFSDMHISSSSMPFIVMYSLNLHNFSVFLVSTEWPRKKKGKICTLVLQFCSKVQFGLLTFKKTNLIPQFLFLGQVYPYTDAMLHNTMRLMLKKSHLYPSLFSLLYNLHI